MDTAEKLGRYADLLTLHGLDSDEANAFLLDHIWDQEFLELAEVARRVKRAFAK